MVDDRDLLADVLHQLELMAGEEHGGAAGSLAAQHVGERLHRDRVEPRERLVKHEQLRLVHQRRSQLGPLLVAVRELLHLGVRPLGESETLEPARCGSSVLRSPPSRAGARSTRAARRHASAGTGPAPPACTRTAAARRRPIGRPSQSTSPLSSSTRPKMARMAVVFPAPFGPRKPSIRPRATETEHPSSACTWPNRLRMSSTASMAHVTRDPPMTNALPLRVGIATFSADSTLIAPTAGSPLQPARIHRADRRALPRGHSPSRESPSRSSHLSTWLPPFRCLEIRLRAPPCDQGAL